MNDTVAENKYLQSQDTISCLEQAKRLLQNDGSLTEAALLLEAAIQKSDLGVGGYEAWVLLGETRCMDEREEAGMSALLEGIRKAEEAGAKGPGMLVRNIPFWSLLTPANTNALDPRKCIYQRGL